VLSPVPGQNCIRELPLRRSTPGKLFTDSLTAVVFCSETDCDRLIKSCTREDLLFVLYAGFHAGLRENGNRLFVRHSRLKSRLI
jgi:hypothetical protein